MKKVLLCFSIALLSACSSAPTVDLDTKIPEGAVIKSFGRVLSVKPVSIDQEIVKDGMYIEKRYGDNTEVSEVIASMKKENPEKRMGWIDDLAYNWGLKKKPEIVMKEYQEVVLLEYPFNIISSVTSASNLSVDQKVEITKQNKTLTLIVLENNLIH